MNKLEAIFSGVFAVDSEDEIRLMEFNDGVWDSVLHMQLVAALEESYNIMIETDDAIELTSFEKTREILKKYGISESTQDAIG